MSNFANPAGAASDAAESYTAALLEVLGDRDPMEIFARAPRHYREAIDVIPTSSLDTPEAEGKWSALGVLHHLVDSELVGALRFRRAIAEDRPAIAGYDQDAWCSTLHPALENALDAELGLELIEVVRAATMRLLQSLDDEQWQRAVLHSERGEESVAHMLKLYAAHDLVHLAQLERIRKAVSA